MMTDFVLSSAEGSQEGSAGRTVFEGSDEFAPVSLPPRLQAPSSVFDGDLWTTEAGLFCVREGVASRVPQVVTSAVAPTDLEPGDVWVDTSTPTWIAPTLGNSWVECGSGNSPVGYMKDSMGFVQIRGLIKSGITGTPVFVLPAGYRPVYNHQFIVSAYPGGAHVAVFASTGNVQVQAYFASGANTEVWLSSIRFPVF